MIQPYEETSKAQDTDLGLSNTSKPKSKRKRSRCWFLTWHIMSKSCLTQKVEVLKNLEGIVDYVFQLEETKKEGLHFQGVFRYKNPRDTWPFMEDNTAHWEKSKS